jgi:hypothetical protein
LPTSFDTSGDMAPAQLSHYFPLPPTRLDTHGSQKSFAASNPVSISPCLLDNPHSHRYRSHQVLR